MNRCVFEAALVLLGFLLLLSAPVEGDDSYVCECSAYVIPPNGVRSKIDNFPKWGMKFKTCDDYKCDVYCYNQVSEKSGGFAANKRAQFGNWLCGLIGGTVPSGSVIRFEGHICDPNNQKKELAAIIGSNENFGCDKGKYHAG